MTRSEPTVSIGMPVYNGENWLHHSVTSLLNQSFDDFELVISDNCSTDGSVRIANELARIDSRITVLRRSTNGGATVNFNSVFARARGRYFKWASCNDYCGPSFLEDCVKALDADDDAVLAYPRSWLFEGSLDDAVPYEDRLNLVDADPVLRFTQFMRNVRLNNVMNGVIRRATMLGTPLLKPYYSSDTWLMAELTLNGKFIEVPSRSFYRRMDADSATRLKSSADMARHWKPDRTPVHLPAARGICQLVGAVFRAPISTASRLQLLRFLGRRAIYARRTLASEIWSVAKYNIIRSK